MKLEKLSRGYLKKFIIIFVVISILGITFMNRSKAKYRVTQSIQIVNGEVNYKVPDLNVLALHRQKVAGNTDDSNYEAITNVPIEGYKLNITKSYCTKPSTNDSKITGNIAYNGQSVSVNNITEKGTKCYLYFDIKTKLTPDERIKDFDLQLATTGTPDFSKTACSSGCTQTNTNGLYKAKEGDGETYYFRGTVGNNWVKFGDFYWRIIRINSNGSIRLIYNGTTAGATKTSAYVNTARFSNDNNTYDDNAYVGYMYGSVNQEQSEAGYNVTHKNTSDSGIKKVVDNWYSNTFSKKLNNGTPVTDYIDINVGFCGDRSPYQYDNASTSSQPSKASYGTGKIKTRYGAYIRMVYTP